MLYPKPQWARTPHSSIICEYCEIIGHVILWLNCICVRNYTLSSVSGGNKWCIGARSVVYNVMVDLEPDSNISTDFSLLLCCPPTLIDWGYSTSCPWLHTWFSQKWWNYIYYILLINCSWIYTPDSKVPGANMRPIWGQQEPGGPHVGPSNFAIWDHTECNTTVRKPRFSSDLQLINEASFVSSLSKFYCEILLTHHIKQT